MLRKEAKTQCTSQAVLCIVGGISAYMQLGTALYIHANIQPYVATAFFSDKADGSLATSYEEGLPYFFQTYFVYALSILGMVFGLSLGKHLLLISKGSDYKDSFL